MCVLKLYNNRPYDSVQNIGAVPDLDLASLGDIIA